MIKDVEFNSDKFNTYMSDTENISESNTQKNNFDIAFDELLSSTIWQNADKPHCCAVYCIYNSLI